jgi:hypothetical protein
VVGVIEAMVDGKEANNDVVTKNVISLWYGPHDKLQSIL